MKELKIKIEAITKQKKSKSGTPFISVKDDAGIWYGVWEKELFSVFKVGETYNVLVEEKGGFQNIRDIVSNEIGVVPSVNTGQRSSENSGRFEDIMEVLARIEARLTEIEDEVGSLNVPRVK